MKTYVFTICLFCLLACSQAAKETPAEMLPEPPEISISDAEVTEADSNNEMVFSVQLSKASDELVQVKYDVQEGTATAAFDYVSTLGTLVFQPGETEKTISVSIIGDNVLEVDESFKVLLSEPVQAVLLLSEAVGTIRNDDTSDDIVVPAMGYETPKSYAGKTLVWQDEFEARRLNLDDWGYDIGTGSNGWGNNELQFYTDENATLQAGYLVIEAREESVGGRKYTSSRIKTQAKKSFTFGRIDIRAVLPEGQGIWPALWMLGEKFATVSWPACGEMDIMELVGHQPDKVHGTVHYGNSFPNHRYVGQSFQLTDQAKFSEKFHVFSLVWEKDKIQWYVDDQLFFEFTRNMVGSSPYPFNEDFFFIFNIAVGGNWPGSPDASTRFPQRMIVDYVRVFQ
ncbi:MAG: family 16 glycosylhydrolase [Bacteroidota bacterium]